MVRSISRASAIIRAPKMRPPSETETSQALRVGGAGPPEPAAAGADVVEAGTALGAQGPAAVASDPVAVAASGLSAREASGEDVVRAAVVELPRRVLGCPYGGREPPPEDVVAEAGGRVREPKPGQGAAQPDLVARESFHRVAEVSRHAPQGNVPARRTTAPEHVLEIGAPRIVLRHRGCVELIVK